MKKSMLSVQNVNPGMNLLPGFPADFFLVISEFIIRFRAFLVSCRKAGKPICRKKCLKPIWDILFFKLLWFSPCSPGPPKKTLLPLHESQISVDLFSCQTHICKSKNH